MGMDFYILGQRIQNKRKSQNKTQENLAEAISVTVGYVSQIERGITKVNLETLSAIAEYLQCDISEFLADTAKKSDYYLYEEIFKIIERLDSNSRKFLLETAQMLEKYQK